MVSLIVYQHLLFALAPEFCALFYNTCTLYKNQSLPILTIFDLHIIILEIIIFSNELTIIKVTSAWKPVLVLPDVKYFFKTPPCIDLNRYFIATITNNLLTFIPNCYLHTLNTFRWILGILRVITRFYLNANITFLISSSHNQTVFVILQITLWWCFCIYIRTRSAYKTNLLRFIGFINLRLFSFFSHEFLGTTISINGKYIESYCILNLRTDLHFSLQNVHLYSYRLLITEITRKTRICSTHSIRISTIILHSFYC